MGCCDSKPAETSTDGTLSGQNGQINEGFEGEPNAREPNAAVPTAAEPNAAEPHAVTTEQRVHVPAGEAGSSTPGTKTGAGKFWINGAPDVRDTDSSEDSDDNTLDAWAEKGKTKSALPRQISNCDTVNVARSIHVYPGPEGSTPKTRGKTPRKPSEAESVADLERQVQELRAENDELSKQYDTAAKTLTLEKEIMTQKHENSLGDLRRDSDAQKTKHEWMLEQLKQERTLQTVKHENAMQELEQRETMRRYEHEQILNDLKQEKERLQAQQQSDQTRLLNEIKLLKDKQEAAMEELYKKEQALGRKEEILSTEKEQEFKRLQAAKRRLTDEHYKAMSALEEEKQMLEDGYKKKILELRNKESALQREYKQRLDTIAEDIRQERTAYQTMINEHNRREAQMAIDFAAVQRCFLQNQQSLLQEHADSKRQYREKKKGMLTKMEQLKNELAWKDIQIQQLERYISTPNQQDLRCNVLFLEDQLVQTKRLVEDQKTLMQRSRVSTNILEMKCELLARVHNLFEEVFIRAMVGETRHKAGFEERLRELLCSLGEINIGGPQRDKLHEQTKKDLGLIAAILRDFPAPESADCENLVHTMLEIINKKKHHDYHKSFVEQYDQTISSHQALGLEVPVDTDEQVSEYTVTSEGSSRPTSQTDVKGQIVEDPPSESVEPSTGNQDEFF